MESYRTISETDTEHAWNKVHQRLQDDGLIPQQAGIARRVTMTSWVAYAASLLVILALGGMSYFMISYFGSTRLMTLETGADNCTFVQTLEDGSVVYVADNSIFIYPSSFRGAVRKVSLAGEAFFDVTSLNGKPFVIETDNALIEVLGTAFNLRSYDDYFELIVEEGLVRVTLRDRPDNPEVVGQWEMLTGSSISMEKLPVVDRTYVSWKMNRMQFRDEKLDNIASVISRNFSVSVEFENEAIRDRRMTVTFDENDIRTIAEVIAFSMDLEFIFEPGKGIIFREKR